MSISIDTVVLFIIGLIFIEVILRVLKGFFFYSTKKDADNEQSRKSWKQARILTYIAVSIMIVVMIIYIVSMR